MHFYLSYIYSPGYFGVKGSAQHYYDGINYIDNLIYNYQLIDLHLVLYRIM
jgi:hypothetical protein